jgi:hypothetical protein
MTRSRLAQSSNIDHHCLGDHLLPALTLMGERSSGTCRRDLLQRAKLNEDTRLRRRHALGGVHGLGKSNQS